MVQGTGPDPRAWVLAMGDARLAQWLNSMFSDNAESNGSSCRNHCPSDCGPQRSRLFGWEPPAYHWDKGFGSGVNNWLVHIEGEGWCNNVTNCLGRKNTCLGSSKQMLKEIPFVWNSEQQAIT